MSYLEIARQMIREELDANVPLQPFEEGNVEAVPTESNPTLGYERNEIDEKRSALLDRLRNGQTWLLDQHQRWQAGDTTAVDDAEFSRVWNSWWALDDRLRADHGFQGCIFFPGGSCPEGFPCHGCAESPSPGVVAQLELAGVSA